SPSHEVESVAESAKPDRVPREALPLEDTGNFWCTLYGCKTYGDLFTPRQLCALNTFSDLVPQAIDKIRVDATAAGFTDDAISFRDGGSGATAYTEAVAVLLALALDKLADYNNAICTWNPTNQNIGHLFTKQAIPMSWDFAETTPLDGGLSYAEIAAGI